MKTYLNTIQFLQKFFLGAGIAILMFLPLAIVFVPSGLSNETVLHLYDISSFAVFAVMLVRPVADLCGGINWIRPLVILRKGLGVLSASIVVSFILSKLMIDAGGYLSSFATVHYWSLQNYALFAHLADISAVILLITSNNLSKRFLGPWWKRIQRLSYVYFYASSLYVWLVFGKTAMLYAMIIITIVTLAAYFINKRKRT